MPATKSPIKDRPLRQAGQSGDERLLDVVFGQMLSYFWIVGTLWILAVVEWIQHLMQAPRSPILFTIVATGVTAYGLIRGRQLLKTAKKYKLGRDGEKVVGELLDRLRANGYRVYHDIPGDKWNIDHVIISTRGVFAVETKTRSKPEAGEPLIDFNGQAVSLDGGPLDEAPIRQSLAQSKQLRTMLKELTGHDFPVRGVVVYPGWYVKSNGQAKGAKTWVLNPKSLHKWIDHQNETIPVDQVKQAATALAKYVRRLTS